LKKNPHILLSTILVLAMFVTLTAGPASAYETQAGTEQFVDLENHWATTSMSQLVKMGVVTGYEQEAANSTGETYLKYYIKPNKLITRAEFSTILARALGLAKASGAAKFNDSKGHWAEGYINALYNKDIVKGYNGGLFRPEAEITRGEIVTMLVKGLNNKESVTENVYFSDIQDQSGHWAFAAIQKAVSMSIVKGYPDGSFGADGKAKRSEVMTMLVNFLNNDSTDENLPEDRNLVAAAAQYQRSIESILESTPDPTDKENPLDWSTAYQYVTGEEKLALDGLAEVFDSLAGIEINYSFDILKLNQGQVIHKSDHTAVVKHYAKMNLKVGTEEQSLEGDNYTYLMKENGKWLVYSNPEIEGGV